MKWVAVQLQQVHFVPENMHTFDKGDTTSVVNLSMLEGDKDIKKERGVDVYFMLQYGV